MNNEKLMQPGKWRTAFDGNGNVITTVYDDAFRALMGFGPENDDANLSWTGSIHPDDAERVEAYFADCISRHPEGMDYDIEYRMMTKQGYHWFHDVAHCERKEDGSVIRMDGYVFDIQEVLDKAAIVNHEKLINDAFAYMISHDDDPVELLKEFAPRVRELLDCDQIIYRDLENVRIMVNSPAIEKTWAVPIDFCRQCEHLDPRHPMYKDGYTEMDNCQEGWRGIPVYKECPIKSSLTRIVYCDGETAGYLAIHYVRKYHRFTEIEHNIIEEFANILSMALSRYEAKKENAELKLINEMQENLRKAYDEIRDANLRNLVLMEAVKATPWSFEISAEDEVVSAHYDKRGEGKTVIRNSDAPMSWISALHPEDREHTLSEFMAAIRDHTGNTPYETTCRIMKPDGDYMWVKTSGRLSRREDGTSELFGIAIDITGEIEEQQKRLLGAVPVSNDILAKESIGMWAFELDEGQPPRMYGDEAMLRLVGLDRQVPPEEMYRAWYDHIDEGSYNLVNGAVARMMAGESAEVQYPWHHPDGHTMIVRCGGVRNPGYTEGIRVEGTHQNVTDVLHFDDEERKVLAETNARMLALEDNFVSLYDLNLDTGEYEMYAKKDAKDHGIITRLVKSSSFYEDTVKNLSVVAYPEDRDGLIEVLKAGSIRKALEEDNHFDYYYRLMAGDMPVWAKIRIVYKDAEKRRVIIGAFNAEEEMEALQKDEAFKNELAQTNARLFALEDDFMSLYDVELESGHYVSYDRDDFYRRNVSDNVVSATEFFKDLRTNVERVVLAEDREAVYNVQTRENIISVLSEKDHIDHYYRIITDNGPMWLKMRIVYKNAEKKNVIVGIFNAEEEMAARQKEEQFKAELLQTNARLFALEDNFESLYDVELESGHYDVFVKGDFFKNNVLDKLSVPHDYFEELRDNIDAVIYEEDRDSLYHTLTRESIRRELAEQDHFDYLYRINSGSGPVWLRIRVVYKNADKKNVIIGVFNAEKDVETKQITEQKNQLEKNMQMISGLASGYNALYYINIDENILNIFALDETKYPGSGEIFEGEEKDFYKIIGGYGLSEQVHPDDRYLFEDFTPEGIREKLSGRKKYSIRFRARTDSGYRWDEMELTKYEDMDEQANAVAVGFTDRDADIRREQEYQLQLEEARVAADAANQSKSNFLFNMSHDIRTPMNAIRGFTTMAKKNADDKEKVIAYLDKIDISGQQLLTLINQVLEMARIESGKIEFEEKPINVRNEFNSMVTVLSEQAKANGLKFIHTLGDIEHNNIFADEARMSSITLNIVGNAMKYTPEGGTVEYDLRETVARKPGYATFVFTVADTGIGMSEEYMKELYEPFSREKSSTVSKIQGTGLGLPIVKSIIDLVGGNIEVNSELGKGTRFDITVDFRINENAEQAAEENEDISLVTFKGRRVLLVEDNEMNREIAKDILEEQGITVEDADDGDVAVAMVKDVFDRGEFHYYDFILMDVQMPRMNGYEATKEIRAMPGPDGVRIPIIAMTANAFEEDRQNALAAGMDEHLAKPIDVNKAFRTIAKFL